MIFFFPPGGGIQAKKSNKKKNPLHRTTHHIPTSTPAGTMNMYMYIILQREDPASHPFFSLPSLLYYARTPPSLWVGGMQIFQSPKPQAHSTRRSRATARVCVGKKKGERMHSFDQNRSIKDSCARSRRPRPRRHRRRRHPTRSSARFLMRRRWVPMSLLLLLLKSPTMTKLPPRRPPRIP